MKNSKDLLSSTLKTAQMGQTGIRAVMDYPMDYKLYDALQSQLQEYDMIEKEVQRIADSHGIPVNSLHPSLKNAAKMMAAVYLSHGDTDSKIAAMTIQGNTRGMLKSLKNRNRYDGSDSAVYEITGKLLDCEKENIQQMQSFV